MNIAFLDQAAHPYLQSALEEAGHAVTDLCTRDRAHILTVLKDYDGLMIRSRLNIDRELLDACGPNFKFVARWGVGTDHINLEYAKERGITVFNINHLGRADGQIRAGGWVRRGNVGTELGSLTVGLIGYGNMGQMTARRLVGFGCKVMEVSLEELQREADVVSLHIFLEGNHYYCNQDWINAFAKPFYFINTARGLAVKTEDLVAGMKAGKVLGAALDVHEYSPGA